MTAPLWLWVAFSAFVLIAVLLDLVVFHRGTERISFRDATVTSAVWIGMALVFAGGLFAAGESAAGGEFLAGYTIEKALSIDNVFVFALLLGAFAVPEGAQNRVLTLGILAALVLRAVFILVGAELLDAFAWAAYAFGLLLIVTGVRMALHRDEHGDPADGLIVRGLRRVLPMTSGFHADRMWVRGADAAPGGRPPLAGRWVATPLFLVFAAIMTTDIVFALDSIPAIFAITSSPFIVFAANAFALLGLRALYFMLAGAMARFAYLKAGLALVLVFVGAKFIWGELVGKVPAEVSLPVIFILVGGSIGLSLWRTRPGGGSPSPAPSP